ncbi:MAG: hypothetical protein KAY22_03120 [Rhizorhabdus sp.]|uniref:hypothetical protein n=1 Tax=Rhizorhabdus sp. TaxID=1968843 RepID=UPI001B4DBE79|nr:hypothetical protein [Rhizorhabdus sp.]MBP8231273.1 hypothetical protein [Rhizorhabdus sp.]
MIGRIGSAQSDLEANLAILLHGGDTASVALAEAQLQVLAGLQRRVDQARGADLVSIRGEVLAISAAAQLAAQQARSSSAMSAAASIQDASERARKTVLGLVDDYYEKKVLDPYLRFSSPEDEAEYRKREAERQAAIQKALAEGTPQGNLRAAQLMEDQLRDAGAHGADQSPDYLPMFERVRSVEEGLGTALAAQPDTAISVSRDPLDAIAPATKVIVGETEQGGHGLSVGSANETPVRTT